METFRKTLAVAAKDLRILSKDRSYVITMFLVPLAVGFFSATVFGGDGGTFSLPAIVVNQDSGPYGESIVNVLVDIKEVNLLVVDSSSEAESLVAGGEYLAAVIIPPDFTNSINEYQTTEVTIIVDPAQASYGRIITSILEEITSSMAIQGEIRYGIKSVLEDLGFDKAGNPDLARAAQAQVEGVLFTQLQRMQTDNPIRIQTETLEGDQVFMWENVFTIMLPAFTVMFAFFIVPALSTELLKEKQDGSLRRLVAAPLPRSSLIGGKVLAYTLMVLIQVIVLFGIGALLLDMPLGKSPLALLLVTIALGLTATTLGMLVAAVSRSIDQAGSIGVLLVFVLGFLGSAFFPTTPIYNMEGFMGTLSRLTPQAQAQIAYFNLLIHNGGLLDVLPQVAYMLGLALVFFLVAIWRFRFD